MPSEKTICVVIPFSYTSEERKRNIQYTIEYYKKNLPKCYIIVVEQDSITHLDEVDIHFQKKINNSFFNKTILMNEGYNISQLEYCADYIIFADADCLVEKNILNNIEIYYEYFDNFFTLPFSDKVHYLTEYETIKMINQKEDNIGNNLNTRKLEGSFHACGGVGIMSNINFYNVGGHENRFKGWGGEDDAFHNKCISLGLPVHRLNGELLHLNHSNSPRNMDNYKNNMDLYTEIFNRNNIQEYIHSLGFNHLEKPCIK